MFSFNTTTTLHHVTVLPRGITLEHALPYLHNHDLLLRLDPEIAQYEALPPNPADGRAKRYKVTDHMHTLPKGLWDTTVTFEAEITNAEDGILWGIKAPLGLVQGTTWRVMRTELMAQEDVSGVAESERGEWSLVEDVQISANRMLVGIVKAKCEQNWRGIHAKFVGHLKGEAEQS